jgi:uncharacterized membrane-anchored protein
MTTDAPRNTTVEFRRQMLNKVPEVTLYFWIIKILCTTVGETFADFINGKLNLGLTNTTYIMGSLLILTLVFQFRARKYLPPIYWLAVVLLSVVGTLITDVMLALTFTAWYLVERTLTVHTIVTTRREAFYWLTILFTFALGTAAGDLIAERFSLGYPLSTALFAGLIVLIAIAHRFFRLGSILAFWTAYILTRPLGASIGDLLSQSRHDGGLGLGTFWTSAVFLVTILCLVIYLSLSHKDVINSEAAPA